jgi:hypothetical protein
MLRYCQHRGVSDEGKVTCKKIARGDNEVLLSICEACPAASCNCGHLRFSLEKENDSAVVIRYGNGKTEVLEAAPSGVRFTKSACAAQLRPVDTRTDCVGCPLRSNGFVHDVVPAVQVESSPLRAKIVAFPRAASGRG